MQNFIEATIKAIDNQNWYAALALALSMPDICGRLEDPTKGSKARFVGWFDKYLLAQYKGTVGPYTQTPHTFLSGADCYALRCAFLHQGEFQIEDQSAQQALEKFSFTAPHPSWDFDVNQQGSILQLQVAKFCRGVCDAVERWLVDVQGKADIQTRMGALGTIAYLQRPFPPF